MFLKILSNYVFSFVLDILCKLFIVFKGIYKVGIKIFILLMEKLKFGSVKNFL